MTQAIRYITTTQTDNTFTLITSSVISQWGNIRSAGQLLDATDLAYAELLEGPDFSLPGAIVGYIVESIVFSRVTIEGTVYVNRIFSQPYSSVYVFDTLYGNEHITGDLTVDGTSTTNGIGNTGTLSNHGALNQAGTSTFTGNIGQTSGTATFGNTSVGTLDANSDITTSGGLGISGNLSVGVRAPVITTYTIAQTDCIVPADTTTGPFTITLPSATGSGRMLALYRSNGSNTLTVAATGGSTIAGSTGGLTSTLRFYIDAQAGTWVTN